MTISVALVAKSMHGDRVEQRRERCQQQILNRDCSRHERQCQAPNKEYGGGRCDQDCPLQSASAPEHDITYLTPNRSGNDNGRRSDRKEESDALRRKPAAGENWSHKWQKHASGGTCRQKRRAKLPRPRRYALNQGSPTGPWRATGGAWRV